MRKMKFVRCATTLYAPFLLAEWHVAMETTQTICVNIRVRKFTLWLLLKSKSDSFISTSVEATVFSCCSQGELAATASVAGWIGNAVVISKRLQPGYLFHVIWFWFVWPVFCLFNPIAMWHVSPCPLFRSTWKSFASVMITKICHFVN